MISPSAALSEKNKLTMLGSNMVVQEIFLLNDFNGDGCITRDEWLGSDAVFDALDQDHDGRLTPDDVRLGFGAALALSTV